MIRARWILFFNILVSFHFGFVSLGYSGAPAADRAELSAKANEIVQKQKEYDKLVAESRNPSVHANLLMDIESARSRLLNSINTSKLDSTFTREFAGKDERSCILSIARTALGLYGDYNRSLISQADWGAITLEEDVYFERHARNDKYVIYGRAENLNPKEFKIQFRAQWNNSEDKLPSCFIANVFGPAVASTELVVVNALGTTIFTRKYLESPKALPLSDLLAKKDEALVTRFSDSFKKEKGYAVGVSEHVKNGGELGIDVLDVATVGGEAALWIAMNRYPKFASFKTLRVLRIATKVFIVGEEATRGVEAVEVVMEGGEPKFVPVKDTKVMERLTNVPSRMWRFADSHLSETGVLRGPTSYKDLLEGYELPPKVKNNEEKAPESEKPAAGPKRMTDEEKRRLRDSLK